MRGCMDKRSLGKTLWSLGPHSPGKHAVLRRYLDAWIPILGSTRDRSVFIDGFAGLGRYAGGEDGSPVIALKAPRDHRCRPKIQAEVTFLFIESEPDRAKHRRAQTEGARRCVRRAFRRDDDRRSEHARRAEEAFGARLRDDRSVWDLGHADERRDSNTPNSQKRDLHLIHVGVLQPPARIQMRSDKKALLHRTT